MSKKYQNIFLLASNLIAWGLCVVMFHLEAKQDFWKEEYTTFTFYVIPIAMIAIYIIIDVKLSESYVMQWKSYIFLIVKYILIQILALIMMIPYLYVRFLIGLILWSSDILMVIVRYIEFAVWSVVTGVIEFLIYGIVKSVIVKAKKHRSTGELNGEKNTI